MGIDFYTDVITKVFEKVVEAVLLIFLQIRLYLYRIRLI